MPTIPDRDPLFVEPVDYRMSITVWPRETTKAPIGFTAWTAEKKSYDPDPKIKNPKPKKKKGKK